MSVKNPPVLSEWDDMRGTVKSPHQKTMSAIKYRRRHLHTFVASSGHPHLCGHCNAELDEELEPGVRIHN